MDKQNFKKIGLAIVIGFGLFRTADFAFGQSWVPFGNPPVHEAPHFVKTIPSNSSGLFAASQGDLFASNDSGKSWQRLFGIRGNGAKINGLEILPDNPNAWYALTTEGLFKSTDGGKNWIKIYDGIGAKNRNVLSLAQNPADRETLYLGTADGILITKNAGKNWARAFAELSKKEIQDMAVDERTAELYFATNNGLYRYHITQDLFRHVFTESLFISEPEIDAKDDAIPADETKNENESSVFRSHVIISKHPGFPVALATAHGVFTSDDEGETWQRLPTSGLGSPAISDLVYSEKAKTLFAATARGIFKFNPTEKHWNELYEGLTSSFVSGLTIEPGSREKLFAATKDGVFYYDIEPAFKPEVRLPIERVKMENFTRLISLEPTAREVQREAIRYADVGNGKIERWQTGSRMRALVPNLTFSKGLDVFNNLHVDTGSTTTPDLFVQGPDDRGKSTDIGLTWDLGDMIFSTSQTSIDSREKLMVELRDEILSEVTRLYFERRRLELELITSPPEDPLERMKTLLRMDELTANLDAFTNGYFSKRLEKLYKRNPELTELWNSAMDGSIITSN